MRQSRNSLLLAPGTIPGEHPPMKNRLRREGTILTIAVAIMTLKIMLGVILIHRWRMQAEKDHVPFGDADDR